MAYPETISSTPAGSTALGSSSPTHTVLHTQLKTAIESIHAELGADPAGSAASVQALLDSGYVVDARRYGVVANGTTNDTSAWTAALATGKSILAPVGTTMVDPNTLAFTANGQRIIGTNRQTSVMKLRSAGRLLDMSGTATATRRYFCGLENIQLDGGDFASSTLLRMYHVAHCFIDEVIFFGINGRAIDGVEVWDTRFKGCFTDSQSSTTLPAWHFRNADVNSGTGFGGSDDNSNMLRFEGCTWETFKGGALWIEQGARTTQNPNHIYLDSCKMETTVAAGPPLRFGAGTKHVFVDNLTVSVMALNSGATAVRGIEIDAAGGWSLTNVDFSNGAVATFTSCIRVNSGGDGISHLDRISFNSLVTVPTTACIEFVNATSPIVDVGQLYAPATGTLLSGSPTSVGGAKTSHGGYVPGYATPLVPNVIQMGESIGMVLTGNLSVSAPLNPWPGQILRILLVQDATGSRTVTWNAIFNGPNSGGPTAITATANNATAWTFVYLSGAWWQTAVVNAMT